MIFFIVILFCSFLLLGIVHYTYKQAGKRKNNMILGISLTEEGFRDGRVRKIIKGYKKIWQWWEIIAIVSLILVLLACKEYISIGILFFVIWCFLLLGGGNFFYHSFHQGLYYLKQENQWFYGEKLHLSIARIEMEFLSTKRPLSDLCFVPVFLAAFIPLFYPGCRAYLHKGFPHIGVVLFPFIVNLVILGFFYCFSRKEKVSQIGITEQQNPKIKTACIRVRQRYWSYGFFLAALSNTAANLVLQWEIMGKEKLFAVDIAIYLLMQLVSIGIVLTTYYFIQIKLEEFRKIDLQPKMVDDDEYWTQGYYNNPYDDRILVNNRIFPGNCINMGKSLGRKIQMGSAVLTIAGILGILILFLRIDFIPFEIFIAENRVEIQAGMYPMEIPISDIKNVFINEDIKSLSYKKRNGIEMPNYLLGDFEIEEQGKVRMYLYKEQAKILCIELENSTIYYNSREEGAVEKIYQDLKEKMKDK